MKIPLSGILQGRVSVVYKNHICHSPNSAFAMMLRWISFDPPYMVAARPNKYSRMYPGVSGEPTWLIGSSPRTWMGS